MKVLLAIMLLLPFDARAAHPAGWLEPDSTTIEALLPTLGEGQLLVVDVSAEWCAPCHTLHNEVLATADAAAVVGDDVGIAIDFDGTYGQELKRAHGVMVVPTTLVLDRQGTELGRVEGYPGKVEYLAAMRDAKAGRFGLEALVAKAKADPKNVALQIELAQARLVHGEEAAGLVALSKIIKADKSRRGDDAAAAGRVKGRWLLRVREDGPAAIVHFKAMHERFRGGPHETAFIFWYGSALRAIGHRDAALALFDAWIARTPDTEDGKIDRFNRRLGKAELMLQEGWPPAQTEALVRELLVDAPDHPQLHYILARILQKRGDIVAARAAIAEAARLYPDSAMYQNLAAELARAQP